MHHSQRQPSLRPWYPWRRHHEPVATAETQHEHDEAAEEKALLDASQSMTSQRCRSSPLLATLCGLLLLVIVVQNIVIFLKQQGPARPAKLSPIGLPMLRDQMRLAGVASRYWNFDELNQSTVAWEAINAGHGVIALTPEFVAQHNLPSTIDHPHDPSKKVYAIESYHLMHCLQWLRRGYVALRTGNSDDERPLEHVLHCFEAIRQSIMCQANDELLTITGHGHARGYNQTRHCRNWDALRDFATEHTACYYEGPDDFLSWKMCDDGSDGLPSGSLW